jgi:hypothetical protein
LTQLKTHSPERRFAALAKNRILTIAGLALLGSHRPRLHDARRLLFRMPMFYAYFTSPMLVLLNLLPPLLLLFLAWFIGGGRGWRFSSLRLLCWLSA